MQMMQMIDYIFFLRLLVSWLSVTLNSCLRVSSFETGRKKQKHQFTSQHVKPEINESDCKMSLRACVFQPRGGLQMALKGHAGTLRQIHSQQIIPMEQAMVMQSPNSEGCSVMQFGGMLKDGFCLRETSALGFIFQQIGVKLPSASALFSLMIIYQLFIIFVDSKLNCLSAV